MTSARRRILARQGSRSPRSRPSSPAPPQRRARRPARATPTSRPCSCCRSTTTTATSRRPSPAASPPTSTRRDLRPAGRSTSRPTLTALRAQGRRRERASPSPPATSSAARPSSPAVPRRAVGGVAQRDGARRQQRRQPRVRRGHRPSCCACSEGGCHPVDGCYFPDAAVRRRRLPVARRQRREARTAASTLLPGTWVKEIAGIKVGFIGMTLEAHADARQPVRRRRRSTSRTRSRRPTPRRVLKKQGVKAIVVLMHEGGYNSGTYNECVGISEPDRRRWRPQFSPEIDQIVTGHTHEPYICSIPDPAGNPRLVTSAAAYGPGRDRDLARDQHPQR